MRRAVAFLAAASLVLSACTSSVDTTTTASVAPTSTSSSTSPPSTTPSPSTTTTSTTLPAVVLAAAPRSLPAFAAFEDVPLLDDTTPYAGPAEPSSLDGVIMSPTVERLLADVPGIAERLTTNGFVVVPGWSHLFQNSYGRFAYDNHPVFVTTDAAYHFLHLAFSKVLRDGEESVLLPILESLVAGLVDATRAQAADLAGSPMEDYASRAAQLMEATASLLGLDVGPIGPLAQQEVDLATEALQFVPSPTTSFVAGNPLVSAANLVDYSLFKPRGHYTRSDDLERYFRAMSMLGQGSFFLNDLESLQVGLLATRALVADPALLEAWQLIYEPTAFMVGMADDYSPLELQAIVEDLVPGGFDDARAFGDSDLVKEIAAGLAATRPVGINPEAAAVRIMGARFVIDSYVLDQLGWPSVGEEPVERRRVFVSPLDVAAAMGSDYALDIQRAAEEPAYRHYEEQMSKMRGLFQEREPSDWASTVYDAWLYALEPKWTANGIAHPGFMQTEAWTAKDLMTGLGSYTELKHDTILYAKQAVLAEGGGDWVEVEPRHWVEPDPVAFYRIARVALLLRDGLDDRGLLTGEQRALLSDVVDFSERLGDLATDELAGLPISQTDNDWLESIGSTMEALWLASSDIDPATGMPSSLDEMDALIADIARTTYFYLEIGTGFIDYLLVLVPNDQGTFQVAEGGVYSYYEFWRPDTSGRLSDEEWRELLTGGNVPDRWAPVSFSHPDGGERRRPAWQAEFLVESG